MRKTLSVGQRGNLENLEPGRVIATKWAGKSGAKPLSATESVPNNFHFDLLGLLTELSKPKGLRIVPSSPGVMGLQVEHIFSLAVPNDQQRPTWMQLAGVGGWLWSGVSPFGVFAPSQEPRPILRARWRPGGVFVAGAWRRTLICTCPEPWLPSSLNTPPAGSSRLLAAA